MEFRKISLLVVLTLAVVGAFMVPAFASSTPNQTVNISVQAINVISAPGTMTVTVSDATPGSEPDAVVTGGPFSVAYTTNSAANMKITAVFTAALPTDLHVFVTPAGGSESEIVDTTAVDVITGLTKVASSKTLTFRATATVNTPIADTTRTITWAIVAE